MFLRILWFGCLIFQKPFVSLNSRMSFGICTCAEENKARCLLETFMFHSLFCFLVYFAATLLLNAPECVRRDSNRHNLANVITLNVVRIIWQMQQDDRNLPLASRHEGWCRQVQYLTNARTSSMYTLISAYRELLDCTIAKQVSTGVSWTTFVCDKSHVRIYSGPV